MFANRQDWGWNRLPKDYVHSPYLSADTQALDEYFEPHETTVSALDDTSPDNGPQIQQQLQRKVRKIELNKFQAAILY